MSVSLQHHHDRAVVFQDGPLTWPATLELLAVLEAAVEGYFYTTVELVVSSPGGETRALLHLLAALGHWRAQGLRFRTQVIFRAASAAAILVCTGDERIAEPSDPGIYKSLEHPEHTAGHRARSSRSIGEERG